MSRPFQFPRKPALRRDDPFVGRDGKNPFADAPDAAGTSASPVGDSSAEPVSGPKGQSSDENLFAAPADAATLDPQPAYRPGGYEMTLPHRGGVVLGLGIIGMVLSLLGGLGGLAGWSGSFGMQSTLFLFGLAPLSFLSLGSSLPACILAGHDLRAMRAGAMDASGRTSTQVGFWLGLLSMLASGAMAAIVVWGIIWLIIAEMP